MPVWKWSDGNDLVPLYSLTHIQIHSYCIAEFSILSCALLQCSIIDASTSFFTQTTLHSQVCKGWVCAIIPAVIHTVSSPTLWKQTFDSISNSKCFGARSLYTLLFICNLTTRLTNCLIAIYPGLHSISSVPLPAHHHPASFDYVWKFTTDTPLVSTLLHLMCGFRPFMHFYRRCAAFFVEKKFWWVLFTLKIAVH